MPEQTAFNFNAPLPYRGGEKVIADAILAATSAEPASIHWLQRKAAQAGADVSDRRIKQIVEELRSAGYIVCARRNDNPGYYVARSAEEAWHGMDGYRKQAISQIKFLNKIFKQSSFKSLCGQMKLECEAALKEE
jgi:hypothetical protein